MVKARTPIGEWTCEEATRKCKICILRGDRVFKAIKQHLRHCKSCNPSHYVFHLQDSGRNERATRDRTELFVFFLKTFDLTPAAQKICKGYLLRCTSWDLKIKYSGLLSKREVGESILEEIRSYTPISSKLRWPPRSYSMKFEKYDPRGRRRVPKENVKIADQELENDNLFRVACLLGHEYMRTRASNVDQLLQLLEIESVMST